MCELCGWDELLDEIDETLNLLDDLPEKASDFADSVREKLEGIQTTVSDNEHATDGQKGAVANMKAGVERWRR